MARGIGGEGGAAGGRDPQAGGQRDVDRARDNRDRIGGVVAGYMSGNPYPGYRGPTGTRNPASKPNPTPGNAGYNPADKPRPSIWDRFFSPRRVANPTPSYQATLSNLGKLFSRVAPTPGAILGGTVADIAGFRSQYSDYTGMEKRTDYDPKDVDARVHAGLPDFAFNFFNKLPR